MTPKAINTIFRRFSDLNPEPKTELVYTNTYTLLVAVVLSAQATDVGVNKATAALFSKVSTPEEMLELGEETLKSYIKTIGLYQSKATYIIALSKRLVDAFGSNVPTALEDLQSLPGVGRKTANVVLNCAFGMPTMAVDTHVFRVSNRLGLVHEKTPEATEKALLNAIPKTWMIHAHHWLILHGRYICKARKPECYRCPVSDLCEFTAKTTS
ncbi:MAG: endonuclease III [Alphaproteobacteria bacterium]|nr:endonuclease III [Alphaproteobacteria bacterium]